MKKNSIGLIAFAVFLMPSFLCAMKEDVPPLVVGNSTIVLPPAIPESVPKPVVSHPSAIQKALVRFDKSLVSSVYLVRDRRVWACVLGVMGIWGWIEWKSYYATKNRLALFWKKRFMMASDREVLKKNGWFLRDLFSWIERGEAAVRDGSYPIPFALHGFDLSWCFDLRFSDLSLQECKELQEQLEDLLESCDEHFEYWYQSGKSALHHELLFNQKFRVLKKLIPRYFLRLKDCQRIKRFLGRL